jgi:hypothetical protein
MDEYDLIGENPAGLALSTGKGWTIVGTRSGVSNASLDIGRYGYDLYKKSGLAVDLSTLAKLDLAKIRDKKFTTEGLARTGYPRGRPPGLRTIPSSTPRSSRPRRSTACRCRSPSAR